MVTPSSKRGWTEAPAFEALANRPGTTVAALSAVIQKPHMKMLNTGRLPKEAGYRRPHNDAASSMMLWRGLML